MSDKSDLYPMHPPSLENHHQVLYRQGRMIVAQASNLIRVQEDFKKLDPGKFDERIDKLEHEVTRVRTAIIVAATILGGTTGGKAILDAIRPPQTIVVESHR